MTDSLTVDQAEQNELLNLLLQYNFTSVFRNFPVVVNVVQALFLSVIFLLKLTLTGIMRVFLVSINATSTTWSTSALGGGALAQLTYKCNFKKIVVSSSSVSNYDQSFPFLV